MEKQREKYTKREEIVRWCNHGGSYLYEGQHVAIEKLVIVH